MKILLSGLLICLFVLITPQLVLACSFDVYCRDGSECVKSKGALYNTCLEGLNSGNKSDNKVKKIAANSNLNIGEDMKLTIKMLQEYLRRKKNANETRKIYRNGKWRVNLADLE